VDGRQQQQKSQSQHQQQQQQQQQQQLDVNQSRINFIDSAQYATVNLQSVVTAGFTTPATPILSTVPTHEVNSKINK
jgi:transcription initiation factor TFIID subunit TAF12